jgi:hypothetical protein
MLDRKTRAGRPENRSEQPKISIASITDRFVGEVKQRLPNLTVAVDRPDNEAGEWWFDVSYSNFHTSVLWQYGHGFGMFSTESDYGSRPDEVYTDAEFVIIRLNQFLEAWKIGGHIAPPSLKDVRQLMSQQQSGLAEALNVRQANISKLENRSDFKISTLRSYIEAMGGHVDVTVTFDSFHVPLALPDISVDEFDCGPS